MLLLAIESSCDETAAAVLENGTNLLSSVVDSQIQVHRPYGGVVPELASRRHIETIFPVVNEAIKQDRIRLDQASLVPCLSACPLPRPWHMWKISPVLEWIIWPATCSQSFWEKNTHVFRI